MSEIYVRSLNYHNAFFEASTNNNTLFYCYLLCKFSVCSGKSDSNETGIWCLLYNYKGSLY